MASSKASNIPIRMLGNLKSDDNANGTANGTANANGATHVSNNANNTSGTGSSLAATLRLRRKRSFVGDPTLASSNTAATISNNSSSAETSTRRRAWKHLTNPFSPPTRRRGTVTKANGASEQDDSESDAVPSPSLRPAMLRAVSASASGAQTPPQLYLPMNARRPTHTLSRELSMPVATTTTTPLDSVSLESPPHVAVRYGDTIRLFARSKYANVGDSNNHANANNTNVGGYVGTFEAGRRFLASKNPSKQGELACVPPVLTGVYRASSFTILSTCGRDVGAPVSYGDVVVLVDDKGRVWNNKIGVGPTTRNGYFGPRDSHIPGEMYLSFYQLDESANTSSDSESEDDDGFLSLSALARSTKNMAETTFGNKPTQMESDVAAAALRTMGRVVYYGDANVIIDVADSNRLRSKFNRVVTHFRKHDEPTVQGGYLRCDGKGKPITFELHGPPLATVQTIDVVEDQRSGKGGGGGEEEEDATQLRREKPSLRVGGGSIAVGSPLEIRDVRPASVVTLHFSDGGRLEIPCGRFLEANEAPFYRVVLGGARALRLQLHAVKSVRRPSRHGRGGLGKTRLVMDLLQLYGGVVVVGSAAAFVLSKLLRLTISLPAMYVGAATVLAVFLLELCFPGRLLKSNEVRSISMDATAPTTADDRGEEEGGADGTGSGGGGGAESVGDWTLSILSIEASPTEKLECELPSSELTRTHSARKTLKVPKAFLFAENGNAAKAAERYQATLAWRQEVNADAILTTPQLHYDAIKPNYNQFLHKTDKLGHPVCYQKIASVNMKELQRLGVSNDELFRHYLFAMEFTLKYAANQCCACDACAGSETHKLLIVMDAKGIGMKDLSGDGAEFIRKCTGVMQRHYPQRSYKIFFVNVPSWFGMAWKGIKPLLNETTRAKTNILNESDTPAGLLEYIDAENLPVEYGGTCCCAGGCEENSAYQKLQKKLVESVVTCQPLMPEDFGDLADTAMTPRPSMDSDAELTRLRDSNGQHTELSSSIDLLPAGLFRDDVVHAGYLLKRPMKHNNFTPIWNRRFFILHADSLRFGKVPHAEVYQIVQLTATTTVRKTHKGNNTMELVTPLMAANGHSLVLFAPTPAALHKWVEALQHAIDKLAGKPPNALLLSPMGSDVEGNVATPAAAAAGAAMGGGEATTPKLIE